VALTKSAETFVAAAALHHTYRAKLTLSVFYELVALQTHRIQFRAVSNFSALDFREKMYDPVAYEA
jgi:hypothetical protein